MDENDGNVLSQKILLVNNSRSCYRMITKWRLQGKNVYSHHCNQEKWNGYEREDTSFNKHFFQLYVRCDILLLRAFKTFSDRKTYVCLLNEQSLDIYISINHSCIFMFHLIQYTWKNSAYFNILCNRNSLWISTISAYSNQKQ